jgi:hypothetical protein
VSRVQEAAQRAQAEEEAMTEERQKRAEKLAGRHDARCHSFAQPDVRGPSGRLEWSLPTTCDCGYDARAAAILAFGEAERAAGREEAASEALIVALKTVPGLEEAVAKAHAAGKAEGRREGIEEAAKLMAGSGESFDSFLAAEQRFCRLVDHAQGMCECAERAAAVRALLPKAPA